MFLDDVAVLINTGFEKSVLVAKLIVKRASINAGAVKKLLNRTGLVSFFPKLLHCAGEDLRLIKFNWSSHTTRSPYYWFRYQNVSRIP